MRNPFTIFTKLLKKGAALILLSGLELFYYMFYILFFCYRLVAVPFAIVGVIINAVDCYQYGFNAERMTIFFFLLVAAALRYMMPCLISLMQNAQNNLKAYIFQPMAIRPPFRYTI